MAENKFFKSSEEVVSMILGLLIVVVISGLVVNYFQKNRGKIDIPGIVTENKTTGTKTTVDSKVTPGVTTTVAGKYTVKRGDSLWKISVKIYGDGFRWVDIYKANKIAIKNPGILRTGMLLVIPPSK